MGRGEPVTLRDFLALLERHMDTRATLNPLRAQPGEQEATCADPSALEHETGFRPRFSLEDGVARLVAWYLQQSGP